METFTLVIGTTPINLWLLLTAQATYAGASVQGSRRMSTPNAPLCNELIILADDANTDTVYGGNTSAVATTDYGYRILTSQDYTLKSNGVPNVPLTQWLVGGAATQKIHVKITW